MNENIINKSNKRGFFTIAFGKHYQKIAYNLLLSAKYNNLKYPFAIVTDSSNKYTRAFDIEIIKKPYVKGFMNKLYIDEYAPFEESIFLDADSLIVKDISFLFDLAKDKQSEHIVYGYTETNDNLDRLYFKLESAKKFKVKFIPRFNGGIYFYDKKNIIFKKVFKKARNLCENSFEEYGYWFTNGEECFLSLAMSIYNVKPANFQPVAFGNYCQYIKKLNVAKHVCTSTYDCGNHTLGEEKDYYIYHVSSAQTYGTIYKEQVGKIKYKDSLIIVFYNLKIFAFLSRCINAFKKILNIR